MKSPIKEGRRQRIYERDGWRCQYCGSHIESREAATIDHVIPTALGGSHNDENLRTACRPCNSTKGDRSTEWLRMFFALARTQYARVITLEQYHQLRWIGVDLEPLPVEPFYYERAAR